MNIVWILAAARGAFDNFYRLINGIALNKVWVSDSVILKGIGQNLKYTIHSSLMPFQL